MAGLVPAIHAFPVQAFQIVDARHKAGHDKQNIIAWYQVLIFSCSTTRWTAGRASIRSFNAV
jgi:hypothetical protein